MTERCFFIELSEIITGKEMKGAKCTKKEGDAPKQTIDFEEMAANSGSLDLDENFYGDQDFDLEEFDQEGFDMGGGEGSAAPFEDCLLYTSPLPLREKLSFRVFCFNICYLFICCFNSFSSLRSWRSSVSISGRFR